MNFTEIGVDIDTNFTEFKLGRHIRRLRECTLNIHSFVTTLYLSRRRL